MARVSTSIAFVPAHKAPRLEKTCGFCGRAFYCTKAELRWRTGEFCSSLCSARGTGVRKRGRKTIERQCEVCSAKFLKRPDHVRRGWGRFCSKLCRIKFNTRPLAERFWEKVTKTKSCWLWRAGRKQSKWDYGTIKESGKFGRMLSAHRVSWELHKGPIPKGACVLHTCDRPSCVNPAHLFLGTHADNVHDMMNKQRCGVSKLTAEQVLNMRADYKSGKFKQVELAPRYGVSEGTVYHILRRRTWAHI